MNEVLTSRRAEQVLIDACWPDCDDSDADSLRWLQASGLDRVFSGFWP